MMKGVEQVARHWRSIPGSRRALLQGAAGLTLALLVWQLLWLPVRQQVGQAERRLAAELALNQRLQGLGATPARARAAGLPITPALLSERALAAGLQVEDMEVRDSRSEMNLVGAPEAVLRWLHEQEQGGARVIELHLQADAALLRVRLALELGGGD